MNAHSNNCIASRSSAFTLLELLVVTCIIAIVSALLLPSLTEVRRRAQKAKCLNNLRQLSLSSLLYAADNDGELPPRAYLPQSWVALLRPYYVTDGVLKCPASSLAAGSPHYIINGFNDYFRQTLPPEDYEDFEYWRWPKGLPLQQVQVPSDVILFGEKKNESNDLHMDLFQRDGNELHEVDQVKHQTGSNFAMLDGGVRFFLNGSSLNPFNLWGVIEQTPLNSGH
jgi:prepilin-type N-terminal cleavage/methylation domain-containing protein